MKTGAAVGIAVVAIAAIAFGAYMIDFDVTEEGALPDVDVSVEGGDLPEVDAEVGSITTGTTTETVEVPDVDIDVDTEEAEVKVPTVDVTPPADD
ncbi:hypothetical protein Q4543_22095 [Salipiger sp. 1_MG-2023]|uniref:hypothetical protein n=1 Tax=Salipiger sp. 1_MG-2023 TaxID=3062665 RepID=UPI0026E1E4C5|nr:hypothetical protein [Salipiger sp. 1_MG-2023]MDO6588194.1 hypothetical protein [Salipiger sp. 1_MG-2023]